MLYILIYNKKSRSEVKNDSGRWKIAIFLAFQFSTPFYEILKKKLQNSANFSLQQKLQEGVVKIGVSTVICTLKNSHQKWRVRYESAKK